MCVSTFAPAADDESRDGDGASLGALLARALVGRAGARRDSDASRDPDELSDLDVSCHAAAVLRHVLAGNRAAQARLLSIPLEMPANERSPPELLLPRLVRYLSAASRAAPAGAAAEEEAAREKEAKRARARGEDGVRAVLKKSKKKGGKPSALFR